MSHLEDTKTSLNPGKSKDFLGLIVKFNSNITYWPLFQKLASIRDIECRIHSKSMDAGWVERDLFNIGIRCIIDQTDLPIDEETLSWFKTESIVEITFSDKTEIKIGSIVEITNDSPVIIHRSDRQIKINTHPKKSKDFSGSALADPKVSGDILSFIRQMKTNSAAFVLSAREFIRLYPDSEESLFLWYDISLQAYYAGQKELGREACEYLLGNLKTLTYMRDASQNNIKFYL